MATPRNWKPDPDNEEKPVIKAWRNTDSTSSVFISETSALVRRRKGVKYTVELLPARRNTPMKTLRAFNNKKKARKYAVQWMKNHPET